jgi:hypothetical protein
MARRLFVNLALAAFAVTVTLAALEGVFRLFEPPPTFYTGRGLYQPDAELGHALRPGIRSADVATSSAGFRDREYPLAKPPGTLRVLGVGDSFTFGSTYPRGIYLEVLETLLAESGPASPVEVLNAGVPGYSTHQELGHLRKYGLRFAPDLVVLGLFPSGDVVENHSDEHLEVVDGELSSQPVGRWRRRLLRSRLFRFLDQRLRARADAGGGGALDESTWLRIEWDRLQVCRRQPPRHVRHGFEVTERLLQELAGELSGRGIDLVVLLIPDEYQVEPQVAQRALAAHAGSLGDYDLELPQRRIGAFLRALGVAVVDPLPALRARARREPVYWPRDTHWNEAGCDVAARALREALLPRLRARAPRP